MKDITEKEFSDFIYEELQVLEYEEVLSNPTVESVFPLLELHTPLKNIDKTENGFPVYSTFRVTITSWNALQRECMEMSNKIDEILREKNILRVGQTPARYDPILQKYAIDNSYEVKYNALCGSFNLIK